MIEALSANACDMRSNAKTTRVVGASQLATFRLICWAIIFWLGGWQAWSGRYAMGSDGISYLDIGDAFWKGDWGAIINGYWSPFYPWLIGGAMRFISPSPRAEFPLVHLVNFVIFCVALAAFDLLLRELSAWRQWEGKDTWPPALWMMLSYVIFLWTTLDLIGLRIVSPDLCVAVFVYLAAGLLLRLARGEAILRNCLLLGATLGFGYLARTALLPLGLVLLAVYAARCSVKCALVAAGAFAFVTCPFIFALSFSKGAITFGESGRLNYAWYVNSVTYRHWQGETAGPARHPTRRVMEELPVYEFGHPVGGTYPLWYDPSYWYDGVRLEFDPARQTKRLFTSLKFFYGTFLNLHVKQLAETGALPKLISPALFALIFCFSIGRWRAVLTRAARVWPLFALAIAAFLMYALVYVEARHIAPFAALFFLGALGSVPVAGRSRERAAKVVVPVIAAAFIFALIISFSRAEAATPDWRVAEKLRQMGLPPKAKVASLGYANPSHTGWARLARARIVAEIYSGAFRVDENDFWRADEAVKKRALCAFAAAGAVAVISHGMPPESYPAEWRPVGETGYFIRFLNGSNQRCVERSKS